MATWSHQSDSGAVSQGFTWCQGQSIFSHLASSSHEPQLSVMRHTGRFIKAVFGTSLLFLLAHVTFQICLHTVPELDGDLSSNCSSWETLSRHIGVSRYAGGADYLGVFIISLVTLVMCDRLLKQSDSKPDQAEGSESSDELFKGFGVSGQEYMVDHMAT
ncbi:hypothetical protein JZ751_020905 [Albula glossodonta]|uniref:Piezo TM1-24 domain-containing protein n=1 Tax=Albula glossodonta TaxID=121402 RepID=A0A8T2PLU3_9TELE|nr:hypothetical protein JZ751_020905 [Albula glossodonta]